MDNEANKSSFITMLFQRFCVNFSVTVITITIVGMVLLSFNVDFQKTENLFSFSGNGLSYGTILQLAAFSAIIAFFSILLFEERFSPKLRFFVRVFLFMIAAILTASMFVILFKWFPSDDLFAWLSFVVLTIIGFAVSFGLTMLKMKQERKKYGKLLAEYKARKNTVE